MAERGYLMYKGEPELNTFYDAWLCDTVRKHARVFLPEEVKNKDVLPGKLVPVMWEWENGTRIMVN